MCVCYLERATGLSRQTTSPHAGRVSSCYESRSQPMCPSTHFEDDDTGQSAASVYTLRRMFEKKKKDADAWSSL